MFGAVAVCMCESAQTALKKKNTENDNEKHVTESSQPPYKHSIHRIQMLLNPAFLTIEKVRFRKQQLLYARVVHAQSFHTLLSTDNSTGNLYNNTGNS